MQLQAIRYFNELVRCRSIRQAASNLGVSPTAIARQLEHLEYHFGAPLVERGARGIELTAAGELLARRARAAMRELDQVRQQIDDLRGLKRGEVTLHVSGAAGGAILAPALAEFSRLYPAIRLTVVVTSAPEALAAAVAGETDLVVTMFSPAEAEVRVRFRLPILHEPIMAPDHPLAAQAEIGLADLLAHPLALPGQGFGARQAFEARLRDAGLGPVAPQFTTASLEMQKELARQGAAVLILPRITVAREIRAGELVCRPLVAAARIATDLQLSLPRRQAPGFAADRLTQFLESWLRARVDRGELR